MIDWSVAIPCFLTAAVEWVEAFTIVLAVSLSIGWRGAGGAALVGLAALALLTAATGGALGAGAALPWLQYAIGVFLLLFGLRWLAKAMARHAGYKKLHDETEEFAETQAALAQSDARGAWLIAFKGMMLEGLEVWLVVVALCMKTRHWASGASAALLALLLVAAAGLALRAPLSRVPENAIKFTVGAMIVAFGTYWTLEALGGEGAWPLGDYSLLVLAAFYLLGGLALATAFRRQHLARPMHNA